MSDLEQRLQDALKQAMKAKDAGRLSVVRMLASEVKSAQLAKTDKPPEPEEVVAAYAKRLRKGADEYRNLGQPERAEQMERELAVVEEFLPKQLSREEIEAVVDRVLRQAGLASPKQMGQAMKLVMVEVKGRADGRVVQEVVREKLSSDE